MTIRLYNTLTQRTEPFEPRFSAQYIFQIFRHAFLEANAGPHSLREYGPLMLHRVE